MSLRRKTLLFVGVALVVLFGLLLFQARSVFLYNYTQLEEQKTRRNVQHAIDVVMNDIADINRTTGDWSAWDDAYAFIQDGNSRFVKSNLPDETFAGIRINLMLFVDKNGRLVYGKCFDLKNQREMSLPEGLALHLTKDSPLLHHPDAQSSVNGIISLPSGPLLVASRPIVTSERQGPIRGSLIMGRFLDEAEVQHLAGLVRLSLSAYRLDNSDLTADIQAAKAALTAGNSVFVQTLDNSRMGGYSLFSDIYGQPALILQVERDRDIYRQGQASLNYYILSILIIGLVAIALSLLILEKAILSRMAQLSHDVNQISSTQDFARRVNLPGRDELSSLGDSVNLMLDVLEKSQRELGASEAKYRAGYRSLFDNMLDGFAYYKIILNEDGQPEDVVYIEVNKSFESLTGLSREKVIGKKASEVIPGFKKGDNKWFSAVSQVACTGRPVKLEINARPFHRWLDVSVYNPDSQSAGFCAIIFHDITERKQMENALRASEERFRTLVESMDDLVFTLDHNLIYVGAFGRWLAKNGLTEEHFIGKTVREIMGDERAQQHESAFQKALTGESVVFDWQLDCSLGNNYYFQTSVSPIRDRQGLVIGIVGVSRDVSERRKLEELLTYLNLHDSLTGLYNRACFEQEMQRLEISRHPVPVGIIAIDVDGLKLVNDTFGHDAGDQLLKSAASVIKSAFREEDVIARIGGDEFAILLPGSERTAVESACQRIKAAVAAYNQDNPDLLLSMSVGFAWAEDAKMDLVFQEADNNMYREKLHHSQSARSAIVQTLMRALEARDFITEGHGERLQDLVTKIAKYLNLTERRITDLRLLAKFHDLGKVGIPDSILFKSGPLNPEESEEMKRHSEIGHRIAQSAPDFVHIADWILKHHEWWNGQGYPLGLKEEDIPLECRILAIADAYDAMISDRPYRQAMTPTDALSELKRCAGHQFDPRLVAIFEEILNEVEETSLE